jgi:hypothetical protein
VGIVYLCHDRQEDRPVALKTFKSEYLPNYAARGERDAARLTAGLDPNSTVIVREILKRL